MAYQLIPCVVDNTTSMILAFYIGSRGANDVECGHSTLVLKEQMM